MDSNGFERGFQYDFVTFGDTNSMSLANSGMISAMAAPGSVMLPPMSVPNSRSQALPAGTSSMPPPSHTRRPSTVTGSDGESSFNDSGYFSSPQTSQFTGLNPHPPGPSSHFGLNYNQSPSRAQASVVSNLVASPRPSWQEDLPNINDEWDKNFINTFEENLFGFDASDLNNIVDGILGSPLKSPGSSPFKSPRQNRSAAVSLGLSPFNHLSTSSVMLSSMTMKRSPVRLGGSGSNSPFKNLFSTPSPIKSLNPHSRTSPLARQRRRILQSPASKPDVLSDNFVDLPNILNNINKDMEPNDDLGVAPFQRTNSLGFTPTEEISSPSFSSFFEEGSSQSLMCEDSSQVNPPGTASRTLQEINNMTQGRPQKRMKMESSYTLRSSPAKSHHQFPSRKSPARSSQPRISVTRHTHLMHHLNSKDALRFVRARFREVLDRASEDAVIRERQLQSKLSKVRGKKRPTPEKPQAVPQPVAGTSSKSQCSGMACFTQIQSHRPAAKRRQEILPKPTPDWPQRQPCKIAPKKKKR